MVKILKKSDSTHSSSKGAVNAYFLTGSFFKKTVVFEAAIFVGQSEDGAEVRCEVSRRVETAVSRYSGPSALRFMVVLSPYVRLRPLPSVRFLLFVSFPEAVRKASGPLRPKDTDLGERWGVRI